MALPAGPSSHGCPAAGNGDTQGCAAGLPWVLVHAELPLRVDIVLDIVLDTGASQQHGGITLTAHALLSAAARDSGENVSRGVTFCDSHGCQREDCSITTHLGLGILSSQAPVRLLQPQNLGVSFLLLTLLPHPPNLTGGDTRF